MWALFCPDRHECSVLVQERGTSHTSGWLPRTPEKHCLSRGVTCLPPRGGLGGRPDTSRLSMGPAPFVSGQAGTQHALERGRTRSTHSHTRIRAILIDSGTIEGGEGESTDAPGQSEEHRETGDGQSYHSRPTIDPRLMSVEMDGRGLEKRRVHWDGRTAYGNLPRTDIYPCRMKSTLRSRVTPHWDLQS